ncbi:ankyrin repeat [Anaeramoeba flamelloides]|uniref:Ankyrin repeat n=1 Tax=Anaeramoeba flamelloides TaxID=1746091 RepID=A0ABQ8YFB6_9EUKA|nr:ankyrin repeat [Anaeramoeba flamelloides]
MNKQLTIQHYNLLSKEIGEEILYNLECRRSQKTYLLLLTPSRLSLIHQRKNKGNLSFKRSKHLISQKQFLSNCHHLYDLSYIKSTSILDISFHFRTGTVRVETNQADSLIELVYQAFRSITYGSDTRKKKGSGPLLEVLVQPEKRQLRIKKLLSKIELNMAHVKNPGHGFLNSYNAWCTFFHCMANEKFVSGIERTYQRRQSKRQSNKRHKTIKICPKEIYDFHNPKLQQQQQQQANFKPIFNALKHNTWFENLVIKNISDNKEIIPLLSQVLQYNQSIKSLILNNTYASGELLIEFGNKIVDNANSSLTGIELINIKNISESGLLSMLGQIGSSRFSIRKKKQIGKYFKVLRLNSIGFHGKIGNVFQVLMKPAFSKLNVLDLSGNRFGFFCCQALLNWIEKNNSPQKNDKKLKKENNNNIVKNNNNNIIKSNTTTTNDNDNNNNNNTTTTTTTTTNNNNNENNHNNNNSNNNNNKNKNNNNSNSNSSGNNNGSNNSNNTQNKEENTVKENNKIIKLKSLILKDCNLIKIDLLINVLLNNTLHCLQHLNLSDNKITSKDSKLIRKFIENSKHMNELNLENCKLSLDSIKNIILSIKNENNALKSLKLNLSKNDLGPEGCHLIVLNLYDSKILKSLKLNEVLFTDVSMGLIIASFKNNSSLLNLSLARNIKANEENETTIKEICLLLENKRSNLTSLDISGDKNKYYIGSNLSKIFNSLLKNDKLTCLNISNNRLKTPDIQLLCKILKENKTIRKLNFSGNLITNTSMENFTNALMINNTLMKIYDLIDDFRSQNLQKKNEKKINLIFKLIEKKTSENKFLFYSKKKKNKKKKKKIKSLKLKKKFLKSSDYSSNQSESETSESNVFNENQNILNKKINNNEENNVNNNEINNDNHNENLNNDNTDNNNNNNSNDNDNNNNNNNNNSNKNNTNNNTITTTTTTNNNNNNKTNTTDNKANVKKKQNLKINLHNIKTNNEDDENQKLKMDKSSNMDFQRINRKKKIRSNSVLILSDEEEYTANNMENSQFKYQKFEPKTPRIQTMRKKPSKKQHRTRHGFKKNKIKKKKKKHTKKKKKKKETQKKSKYFNIWKEIQDQEEKQFLEKQRNQRNKINNIETIEMNEELIKAIKKRSLEKIKKLFQKKKAKINMIDPKDKSSVLHYVCLWGNPEILSFLLSIDGSKELLNLKDKIGRTPLHRLMQKGINMDCVQLLSDYDVDWNVVDASGSNPLQTLVYSVQGKTKYLNSIECNFENNNNYNNNNYNNNNYNDNEMKKNDRTINSENKNINNNENNIKTNSENNDINKSKTSNISSNRSSSNGSNDSSGNNNSNSNSNTNPNNNHNNNFENNSEIINQYLTRLKILDFLLSQECNYNSMDLKGNTVLQVAASKGLFKIVSRLLEIPDCNINTHDSKGLTPLHKASRNGYYQIVKILIEKGANISLLDHNKKSALDMAKMYQQEKCVEILEEFVNKNKNLINTSNDQNDYDNHNNHNNNDDENNITNLVDIRIPFQIQGIVEGFPKSKTFKICVLGAEKSGKTKLVDRFIYGNYYPQYLQGIENVHHKFIIVEGREMLLHIYDVSGEQIYELFLEKWINECDGFILNYSIDQTEQCFDQMETKYIKKIVNLKQKQNYNEIPFAITSSKNDLKNKNQENEELLRQKAKTLSEKLSCSFVETSAKNNMNINTTFVSIVKQMYNLLNRDEIIKKEENEKRKAEERENQLKVKKREARKIQRENRKNNEDSGELEKSKVHFTKLFKNKKRNKSNNQNNNNSNNNNNNKTNNINKNNKTNNDEEKFDPQKIIPFKDIIQDEILLMIFEQYLKDRYAEENLLFYKEVKKFQKIHPEETGLIAYYAKRIFNNYVSNTSEFEVNIEGNIRKDISLKIEKTSFHPDMFNNALKSVVTILSTDSYNGFIESKYYTKLLKLLSEDN